MLKLLCEIFEFSEDKFRKIPILKEFEWFEWFEWFGPSPIEPFNSGSSGADSVNRASRSWRAETRAAATSVRRLRISVRGRLCLHS